MDAVKKPLDRRIFKEIQTFSKNPLPGITCAQDPINPRKLHVLMEGPEETPYCGGSYKLEYLFPEEYPFAPPLCRFMTRVYHPNIDRIGRICLDILGDSWSPALEVCKVLLSIKDLLLFPDAEDGIDETVARHFRDNYADAAEEAKRWNAIHAVPDGAEPGQSSFSPCRVLQLQAEPHQDSLISVKATNLAGDVIRHVLVQRSSTLGDLRLALDLLSLSGGVYGPAQQNDALQRASGGDSHGLGWFGPPELSYVRNFSNVQLLVGEVELCGPDDMLALPVLWPLG